MAVYEWKRPKDAKPSDLAKLAVEWNDGAFLAFGNYVLRFDGRKPTSDELVGLYLVLPVLERAPCRSFPDSFPGRAGSAAPSASSSVRRRLRNSSHGCLPRWPGFTSEWRRSWRSSNPLKAIWN